VTLQRQNKHLHVTDNRPPTKSKHVGKQSQACSLVNRTWIPRWCLEWFDYALAPYILASIWSTKMTALMREWIVETTKDELRLALDWKKNEAFLQSRGEHALGTEDTIRIKIEDGAEILPQSMLEPPREYVNDGSNFHISLYCGPGSTRTVQIASVSDRHVQWISC